MTATTLSRGMMPLLGSEQTCWSFGGFGDKTGQVSNMVCIAAISDDGKTITIAPFGENCMNLIDKAKGIVQQKLLATLEGTTGNARLVASEAMIANISQEDVKAKKVKVMLQGGEKPTATVVIADSVNEKGFKLLASEFGSFAIDMMKRAATATNQ